MRSLLIAILLIAAPLSLPMASAGPSLDVLGGTLYVEVDRNMGQPWAGGTRNVYVSSNAVPFDAIVYPAPYCTSSGCWESVGAIANTPVGRYAAFVIYVCTGIERCGAFGAAFAQDPGQPPSTGAFFICGIHMWVDPLDFACGVGGFISSTPQGAFLMTDDGDQVCIALWLDTLPSRCLFHSTVGDPFVMTCETQEWFRSDGDCAGVAVTSAPASCAYVLLGRGGADRYPVVCVRP